jgi:hypothetical protein
MILHHCLFTLGEILNSRRMGGWFYFWAGKKSQKSIENTFYLLIVYITTPNFLTGQLSLSNGHDRSLPAVPVVAFFTFNCQIRCTILLMTGSHRCRPVVTPVAPPVGTGPRPVVTFFTFNCEIKCTILLVGEQGVKTQNRSLDRSELVVTGCNRYLLLVTTGSDRLWPVRYLELECIHIPFIC